MQNMKSENKSSFAKTDMSILKKVNWLLYVTHHLIYYLKPKSQIL